MMAGAEIALVCVLKVRVSCHDRLCVNSDADETQAYWENRCVREALPHSSKKFDVPQAKPRSLIRRGANHKLHAMTSSKIFERGTSCGTNILSI